MDATIKALKEIRALQKRLREIETQLVSGGGGGVTDHGELTGLSDNDHPQYLLEVDKDQLTKARLVLSSAQSIAHNSWADITWGSESFDTGDFWSSGEPKKITFQSSGFYALFVEEFWDASSTGIRQTRFLLNGGGSLMWHNQNAQAVTSHRRLSNYLYQFSADDYIIYQGYQSSGGALDFTPTISIYRIGD